MEREVFTPVELTRKSVRERNGSIVSSRRLTEQGRTNLANYYESWKKTGDDEHEVLERAIQEIKREKKNATTVEQKRYLNLAESSMRMRVINLHRREREAEEKERVLISENEVEKVTKKIPEPVGLMSYRTQVIEIERPKMSLKEKAKTAVAAAVGLVAVAVIAYSAVVWSKNRKAESEQEALLSGFGVPGQIIKDGINISKENKNVSGNPVQVATADTARSMLDEQATKTKEPTSTPTQTSTPTTIPTETATPTPAVKEIIDGKNVEWLNQAVDGQRWNAGSTFKVSLSENLQNLSLTSPEESSWVTEKITVNTSQTIDEADTSQMNEDFTDSHDSRYFAGIEREPNTGDKRIIIYGHSGETWPFNWARKIAREYNGQDLSDENLAVYFTNKDGITFIYKITAANMVNAKGYNGTWVTGEGTEPGGRDLSVAGLSESILEKEGIDIVACGTNLEDEKAVISTELAGVMVYNQKTGQDEVVPLAGNISQTQAAGSLERSNNQDIMTNQRISMEIINNYFSSNPLKPGQTFSFNEVMGYYGANGWTTDMKGKGACDVATAIYKALMNYAKIAGLSPIQVPNENGQPVYRLGIFEYSAVPHSKDEGIPEGEIAVSVVEPGKKTNGDTDLKIRLADGVPEEIEVIFNFGNPSSARPTVVMSSNIDLSDAGKVLTLFSGESEKNK